MTEAVVAIRQLWKKFPQASLFALSAIDAEIPRGKIVGLVGPDGAGKTTLIRLIAGLLLPTEGSIHVAGHKIMDAAAAVHALIGYMPQRFSLYDDLSVLQNLQLYAALRGLEEEKRQEVFTKLLHFTGLAPFQKRLAKALSGGMRQKLGLACALVGTPRLLLLDEPSVGVDPISRRELWKMIYALLDEGISVLWSTAYLDEAEKCHKVLLLREGKLLYSGDPSGLTARVQGRVFKSSTLFTSRQKALEQIFLNQNIVDGVVQGKELRIVAKNSQHVDRALFDVAVPRFEDAFIDLLGNTAGAVSQLAENTPLIAGELQDVIIAEGITKKFGHFTAAEKINFSVAKGEIFGLLGPNGAGKSTIFRMLCGLLRPSEGKAFVSGVDLQSAPGEARSHIGYMAQKFSLYGTLSVMQNLEFFAGIYGLKGAHKKQAIEQMIAVFSLAPYLTVNSGLLPLGFKQRLALACATMHNPKVLFLDEPTSGVDPIIRREFWNHINGLSDKGVTIMVTTHFMDEAEYCDRIALIYRGRLIQIDTPEALKEIAKSSQQNQPTLEDAFIKLIENYDAENQN